MTFNVSDFCKEKNINEADFSMGVELYMRNNIHSVLSLVTAKAVSDLKDFISSEISASKPEKKSPGRPRSVNSEPKNKFYAPFRETILCEIHSGNDLGDGRFNIMFKGVNDKSYGTFWLERIMTEGEVISMFFDTKETYVNAQPDFVIGDLVREYVPKESVLKRIPNFSDVKENIGACMGYIYNVDVKRKTPDSRESYEVLSIEPYEVKQSAGVKNGHSDL